ncbi:hypothetical protein Shyhy02_23850 [Streptomyces hygroscopicus subsp. hygroscopicus]|nr:hypothetical protein Shyhy02_23850 [Streptomyces hygroscopicus subsp. hygroscopicus]
MESATASRVRGAALLGAPAGHRPVNSRLARGVQDLFRTPLCISGITRRAPVRVPSPRPRRSPFPARGAFPAQGAFPTRGAFPARSPFPTRSPLGAFPARSAFPARRAALRPVRSRAVGRAVRTARAAAPPRTSAPGA